MRTAIPTRLQGAAIDRVQMTFPRSYDYWRLWLHTNDHVNGTFLELHNDGSIIRVTTRDGYDDRDVIKPKDE
jgi:hypothetical protein